MCKLIEDFAHACTHKITNGPLDQRKSTNQMLLSNPVLIAVHEQGSRNVTTTTTIFAKLLTHVLKL